MFSIVKLVHFLLVYITMKEINTSKSLLTNQFSEKMKR